MIPIRQELRAVLSHLAAGRVEFEDRRGSPSGRRDALHSLANVSEKRDASGIQCAQAEAGVCDDLRPAVVQTHPLELAARLEVHPPAIRRPGRVQGILRTWKDSWRV